MNNKYYIKILDNIHINKNIVKDKNTWIDLICNIIEKEVINDKYIIGELKRLKNFHTHTVNHCVRVGVLSGIIGIYIGMSKKDLTHLIISGLLHDIGKVQIPLEILNKPSKLTDFEFDFIKKHPIYGYERLSKNPSINPIVLDTVLHHHEKLDGTGYPDSLRNLEISIFSQIVGIADIFDAITSDRPYHDKISIDDAFDVLINNKQKLDKNLIRKVIDCISVHINDDIIISYL